MLIFLQMLPRLVEAVEQVGLSLLQFLQFEIDRGETGRGEFGALPQPLAFAAKIVDLRLAGDRFVLQMGRAAHLLEVLRLVGGDLLVQLGEPVDGGLQHSLMGLHFLPLLLGEQRDLLQSGFGSVRRLGQGPNVHGQISKALAGLLQFGFEVAT